jgi:hypothetical protein
MFVHKHHHLGVQSGVQKRKRASPKTKDPVQKQKGAWVYIRLSVVGCFHFVEADCVEVYVTRTTGGR